VYVVSIGWAGVAEVEEDRVNTAFTTSPWSRLFMIREPIRRTNERALDPQTPRVSTQREEKWKVVVKLEYFLNLADSAVGLRQICQHNKGIIGRNNMLA